MKKMILLFSMVVPSLYAMENDNNNGQNALIQKKNTDWNIGASRFIIHHHQQRKNLLGKKKWRNCWRLYAPNCCEKIKANKCQDFENPSLQNQDPVVAFYDVTKKLMPEFNISGKSKKKLFDIAKNNLDPNAKPQAVSGVLCTLMPPESLEFYDNDNQVIFYCAIAGITKLPLSKKEKDEIARFIDITQLSDEKIKMDVQVFEEAKKDKELKRAQKKVTN